MARSCYEGGRLGEDVVAQNDGAVVVEQAARCWAAATRTRAVDNVVVDEAGGMQ